MPGRCCGSCQTDRGLAHCVGRWLAKPPHTSPCSHIYFYQRCNAAALVLITVDRHQRYCCFEVVTAFLCSASCCFGGRKVRFGAGLLHPSSASSCHLVEPAAQPTANAVGGLGGSEAVCATAAVGLSHCCSLCAAGARAWSSMRMSHLAAVPASVWTALQSTDIASAQESTAILTLVVLAAMVPRLLTPLLPQVHAMSGTCCARR